MQQLAFSGSCQECAYCNRRHSTPWMFPLKEQCALLIVEEKTLHTVAQWSVSISLFWPLVVTCQNKHFRENIRIDSSDKYVSCYFVCNMCALCWTLCIKVKPHSSSTGSFSWAPQPGNLSVIFSGCDLACTPWCETNRMDKKSKILLDS